MVWAFNSRSDSFRDRHTQRGFTANQINFSAAAACKPLFDNDLNDDGRMDVADLNALLSEVKKASNGASFDVNGDTRVDTGDISTYIRTAFNSDVGDANLDGLFSTADFVTVSIPGQYEDSIVGNSRWETGDWNGDAEFNTSDLVFAFLEAGFEAGPRAGEPAAVPEPSACTLSLGLLAAIGAIRRRLR
jgi:hypothetical protein